MELMTIEKLQQKLNEMDDGVLKQGSHSPGGRDFCALEFESQVRGRSWSDHPTTLPDIRPINDAYGNDDKARTEALLPVMAALWDWSHWSPARRTAWASKVAIATVNRIISKLPKLPADIQKQCQEANDLKTAAAAARYAAAAADAADAAHAAAAADAADAAHAARSAADAADAARYAADAADAADAKPVLNIACSIWIEAALLTQDIK